MSRGRRSNVAGQGERWRGGLQYECIFDITSADDFLASPASDLLRFFFSFFSGVRRCCIRWRRRLPALLR